MKTRNKFGNSASSLKFILMDIPGFDERGSVAVTQNCQISQVLASAFIFVTSMSTYNLSTSNDRLLQLLKSHNGNETSYQTSVCSTQINNLIYAQFHLWVYNLVCLCDMK